jgi:Ni,Fe-hydrogenase I large subunit
MKLAKIMIDISHSLPYILQQLITQCEQKISGFNTADNAICMVQRGFLGTFTKLQKVIISFIMCVCPSAWNNLAPTG